MLREENRLRSWQGEGKTSKVFFSPLDFTSVSSVLKERRHVVITLIVYLLQCFAKKSRRPEHSSEDCHLQSKPTTVIFLKYIVGCWKPVRALRGFDKFAAFRTDDPQKQGNKSQQLICPKTRRQLYFL